MAEPIVDQDTGEAPTGAPTGAPAEASTEAPAEPAADQTTESTEGSGTALDTDPGDTVPTDVWPEDWRSRIVEGAAKGMSEEDAKAIRNVLTRYQSPETMGKALVDLRRQISSGQYKKGLPEGASEDEIAQWRSDNGIPPTPDAYNLDLDGRVLPEADQELVKNFLETAHESNFPPEHVNKALQWYSDLVEQQAAQQIEADQQFKQEAVEELRQEWGPEFKANTNAIKSMLGEEMTEKLMFARDPDGKVLGNSPDVLRFLAGMAREMNPAAALGLGGETVGTDVQGELDALTEQMRNMGSEYYTGVKDDNGETAGQRRFRQLIDAKQKLDARK